MEAEEEIRNRKEGGTEEEGRKERGEEDVEEGKYCRSVEAEEEVRKRI